MEYSAHDDDDDDDEYRLDAVVGLENVTATSGVGAKPVTAVWIATAANTVKSKYCWGNLMLVSRCTVQCLRYCVNACLVDIQ
jgi:hypothetical protein